IISETLDNTLRQSDSWKNDGVTWENEYEPLNGYTAPADAKYDMVLTISANGVEQVKFMMADHDDGSLYAMTNDIYEATSRMTEMISSMKTAFLIIGCVVGVFAALMLFNFITVSISAKSKEIGILRAVGARGTDVFKIFFSESGCIAAICFLISSVATYFVCNIINGETAELLSLKLLEYGALQIGLILAISLVVSLLATLIPVYLAARKPPVESIRAL
ncbi:MAG: ABC transporter permease, partial [Eubacteriales bacterium]